MATSPFQPPTESSPQPTVPHSTSAAAAHQPQVSSVLPLAAQVSHQDPLLSSRTCDDSTATEEYEEYTDDEAIRLSGQTVSSRSSISSLPASVAPSAVAFSPEAVTPTRSPKLHGRRVGSLSSQANRQKWRDSPFRNPSSVQSMQMQDEDDIIPFHSRRSSRATRNISALSTRCSGSTPQAKRQNCKRDSLLSPKQAKVKREFPLVLLHCSLLPPTIPVKARTLDAALLQAVLPEAYWRRWELLTDRITYDREIQSRGVLIPHPRADYDLLEERLLESLELVKPRLRSGHYFGSENVDELEESESEAEAATAPQGTKCQDCGKRLVEDISHNRKWEVKVYAANGLMRAGAWSAAWNEMEKVDIEVSVHLPEELRRMVEEKCLPFTAGSELEAEEVQGPEVRDAESRKREIYGSGERDQQEPADSLFEASHLFADSHHEQFASQQQCQPRSPAPAIEFKQLIIISVKILAHDKRNTLIAVLSLALLFFASSISRSSQQAIDPNTTPVAVSEPSLHAGPQRSDSLMPSVSPASFAPPCGDAATAEVSLSSPQHESPTQPVDAAPVDLQISLLDEISEVVVGAAE